MNARENDPANLSPAPPTNADGELMTGREMIRAKLKQVPRRPGVYRFLNRLGDVLYVGKAKDLRARISSYGARTGLAERTRRMVAQAVDIITVTTATESEALLLEGQLIKRYRPRFNVLLRDDKSFPFILIRSDHDWPQIRKHRGARRAKGSYFGPFASAGAVNKTINTLQKAFLLRSCTDATFESRTRPCLLYQIKRCAAPCVDRVSVEEYEQLVADAKEFLSGRSQRIQRELSQKMQAASDTKNFEQAAIYRDRIRALTAIQGRQTVSLPDAPDSDAIAIHQEDGVSCVQVFFFRAGQNWGNRAFFPKHAPEDTPSEVLAAFASQFYENKPAPRLLMFNETPIDAALLGEALSLRSEYKVQVLTPRRGEKRKIIELAERNARDALRLRMAESASQRAVFEELADLFDLDGPPNRIEAYDNSHISGQNALGAMVVAGPDGYMKSDYRRFNIKDKELEAGDDYGMMREVLSRRFARLLKEDAERERGLWPDLLLIDGGQGQLGAAQEVLADLGVDDVTLVAIAKGPDRNAGRERFFMENRAPFSLEPGSPALYYLQRVRDEVHRFAITGHRGQRAKTVRKSALDDVPGIGPARKKALLSHFGSARAVQGAALEDLEAAEGISKKVARQLYDHFHPEG